MIIVTLAKSGMFGDGTLEAVNFVECYDGFTWLCLNRDEAVAANEK